MGNYRLVIVDDHALFRQGLRRILAEKDETEVVGEAGDGLEVFNLLDRLASNQMTPHLVMLDISMPGLRGTEVIRGLKMKYPDMKVLMLTMYKDKEHFYQSMSAGADGYFVKNDPETELFSAIDKIRQGGKYVSPSLSEELAEGMDQLWRGIEKPVLTTREIEVIKLITGGKSNKEIAVLLSISIHTVEHHRAHVMKKLNLKGTADLVKYAIEKRYL
jgi:DNA-binding NarL/FixJ family response regulator